MWRAQILIQRRLWNNCDDEFFKDEKKIMYILFKKYWKCKNRKSCDKCIKGYAKVNEICTNDCPSGYYEKNGICWKCTAKCCECCEKDTYTRCLKDRKVSIEKKVIKNPIQILQR